MFSGSAKREVKCYLPVGTVVVNFIKVFFSKIQVGKKEGKHYVKLGKGGCNKRHDLNLGQNIFSKTPGNRVYVRLLWKGFSKN